MNYKNNLNIYNNAGKRRAGLFSPREKVNQHHPADKDKENRAKVLEQLQNYLDEGKQLKEATSILASNEDIREQFKYLIDAGLNLEAAFEAWYTSRENTKKKARDRIEKMNYCEKDGDGR